MCTLLFARTFWIPYQIIVHEVVRVTKRLRKNTQSSVSEAVAGETAATMVTSWAPAIIPTAITAKSMRGEADVSILCTLLH
jgi:hypothetical protein